MGDTYIDTKLIRLILRRQAVAFRAFYFVLYPRIKIEETLLAKQVKQVTPMKPSSMRLYFLKFKGALTKIIFKRTAETG